MSINIDLPIKNATKYSSSKYVESGVLYLDQLKKQLSIGETISQIFLMSEENQSCDEKFANKCRDFQYSLSVQARS